MNHLGRAMIAKPDVFGDKMTRVFSSYNYSDNPMTSVLSQTGREVTINSNEWEWQLRGASTRPLIYQGAQLTGNPGQYNTTFEVILDLPDLQPGDVIHPGSPKYQVRVQTGPQKKGVYHSYRVAPVNKDDAFFIPTRYFKPGQKWSKLFSQYPEASEQDGSTTYALPMTLKNRLSRYRKKYQVTGDAANEVLAVKVPDSGGKMHNMWIKYAETEYWSQWYRELERGNWYSRSSDKVEGANGRPVYSGPGIQELLEDSHTHFYNVFSAKLLEEFTMDIFYNRVTPGASRKLKVFTGEYGMLLFHRAVTNEYQGSGFITVDSNFIESSSSDYHSNSKAFGYQFTKYKMANGTEVEVIHNPLYDDREIHFDIDPVTGYPTESMRFTFMDFSGEGTESNVKRVKKRNGYSLVYVNGLQNPYGPVKNAMASHAGDYYSMHVKEQCGVHIEDVTRCGELILKRA